MACSEAGTTPWAHPGEWLEGRKGRVLTHTESMWSKERDPMQGQGSTVGEEGRSR